MKKAFQVNLECSARARRFSSMQDRAKLWENLQQRTFDQSLKGNLQNPALRKQKTINANFVSLGSFTDIGLVLNLLTMLYAFDMHSLLSACIHFAWLASTDGPLGRGKSALYRNLIRALPHPTYRSANATPSVVILTHLGKMENS